jgi:hypothetical protein
MIDKYLALNFLLKSRLKKFDFQDIWLTLQVVPGLSLEYSKQVVLLCGQTSFPLQKSPCQLRKLGILYLATR